jgi:glycine/D-amino acid oxidase-like deaminating enzyme
MSSSTSRPRVAVIGGGVLGVSTALHLGREGADTVLVTEADLASGATGRSLSWLNSFGGNRSDAYHALRVLGIDRYRTLSDRAEESHAWLKFDGGLTWAAPGDTDRHRAAFAAMRRHGYDAHWLRRDQVADWTPGVDPAAIPDDGAIFNPGEGWVDLVHLVRHLAAQFSTAGVELIANSGQTQLEVRGDRVTGVVTGAGQRLAVDAAVLATGPDVPTTLAKLGVRVPDATPHALLVQTSPIDTALRATLNTPHVSVRPTPSGALAMDSDGAAEEVIVHPDGSYEVKDATIDGLLQHASALLAGHPELRADWYGVGRKPIPGDGEPVLGTVDQLRGLSVAFSHSGATIGLIAGELLARQIVTGAAEPLLAPFQPGRFA